MSWKTSLFGILGLFFLGMSKLTSIPHWASDIAGLVAAACSSVGLLFSRDNKVSSEDVGIKSLTAPSVATTINPKSE